MTAVDFVIREAVPNDGENILSVLKIIGSETPFLIIDEKGLEMSTEAMRENLAKLYASTNNVLFVALVNGEVVAVASVKASSKSRMEHIGEMGISILKDYWGFGLGSLMMEEIILWAKESQVIRRLELTVQDRNRRAIHVYEKFGFKTEAIMPRGAKTDEGEFLDVHLMSRMID